MKADITWAARWYVDSLLSNLAWRSSRGHGQVCQIFQRSTQGFRFCKKSEFAISCWLALSPLTHPCCAISTHPIWEQYKKYSLENNVCPCVRSRSSVICEAYNYCCLICDLLKSFVLSVDVVFSYSLWNTIIPTAYNVDVYSSRWFKSGSQINYMHTRTIL